MYPASLALKTHHPNFVPQAHPKPSLSASIKARSALGSSSLGFTPPQEGVFGSAACSADVYKPRSPQFSEVKASWTEKELLGIRYRLKRLSPFLPLADYDKKLAQKNKEVGTSYLPLTLYERFLEQPFAMQEQIVTALEDPLLALKLKDPTLEGKRELCDVLWETAYEGNLSYSNLPKHLKSALRGAIHKKSRQCEPHAEQLLEEIEELLNDGNAPSRSRKDIKKILLSSKQNQNVKTSQGHFNRVLSLMGWKDQLTWHEALQLALDKARGRYQFDAHHHGELVGEEGKKLKYHRRKYSFGAFEKLVAAHRIGDVRHVTSPSAWLKYAQLKWLMKLEQRYSKQIKWLTGTEIPA